ncbi:hypothetical protein P171DRAFT_48677 [Karstenula rhodostoma CBS 690.94]|uniref:Uncharacterized protein n=1 Tax=Karstenula rhodostoma CBS 690.94 TaxID=1392251 RepID=A0A9P4PG59_9PLEO|nr:hypothetical protein P171DRAFT_48677 [Karstenula rhodostoma CBS 690.94]
MYLTRSFAETGTPRSSDRILLKVAVAHPRFNIKTIAAKAPVKRSKASSFLNDDPATGLRSAVASTRRVAAATSTTKPEKKWKRLPHRATKPTLIVTGNSKKLERVLPSTRPTAGHFLVSNGVVLGQSGRFFVSHALGVANWEKGHPWATRSTF